jgi:integrase
MSIHRREGKGGTSFEVRWREGTRNRSRTFRSEDEAKAHEGEMLRRRRLGAFAPTEPSDMPLHDWLIQWVRTSGVAWAKTTRTSRASLMDKWIDPYIGHVPLRELGRARVREWRAEIVRDGSPPVNTNNATRVLSAALGVAESDGLIPGNPVRLLGKVPEPPTDRRAWDRKTVAKIVAAMPTDRDRLIVAVMAYAGLRPAEVVALEWRDIGESVRVWRSVQYGAQKLAKGVHQRAIPTDPLLKKAIAKYGPEGRNQYDLVAPPLRGKYLNWQMWTRKVWSPARTTLGLTGVPYDLRHTAASQWIADGHDLMTVASWLGHSPKVTLDHYAHLFTEARLRSA